MSSATLKPILGRPTKFDAEIAAVVVDFVRRGCSRRIAANGASLGRSTFLRWLARGKVEHAGPFRDFWDAIKKAEAEAVREAIDRILSAAKRGAWKAAAWWLERTHPEYYSTASARIRALQRRIQELEDELSGRGQANRLGSCRIGILLPERDAELDG